MLEIRTASAVNAITDPLPSWNDGPVKQSIVKFIARVTTRDSVDLISIKSKDGNSLDGGQTYRLTVPRMSPSGSIGRQPLTTAPLMLSSATCRERAAPLKFRKCRKIPMDRGFGRHPIRQLPRFVEEHFCGRIRSEHDLKVSAEAAPMRTKTIVYSAIIALVACSAQAQNSAQSKTNDAVLVTADNFVPRGIRYLFRLLG